LKKGDMELLEKLNQGLLIVKTNGEYDRIYDKWLTSDDPWRKVQKYLLPAIIMVIAIALIAGIWLVTLQRLVSRRNRELAARKRADAARETLIQELPEALDRVKQLSGLLPICASCKKIRDDKGYWTQIEAYVRDHSEAEFSHGICPECEKKLYPEFTGG